MNKSPRGLFFFTSEYEQDYIGGKISLRTAKSHGRVGSAYIFGRTVLVAQL